MSEIKVTITAEPHLFNHKMTFMIIDVIHACQEAGVGEEMKIHSRVRKGEAEHLKCKPGEYRSVGKKDRNGNIEIYVSYDETDYKHFT